MYRRKQSNIIIVRELAVQGDFFSVLLVGGINGRRRGLEEKEERRRID